MGVATSSSRLAAEMHLGENDLLDRFHTVKTRDEVTHGKPHPELFLAAAEALDRRPERCLVIEDSYNGIRSAHAAGMMVVMVPDMLPPTEEVLEMCHSLAEDLMAVEAWLRRETPFSL